MFKQYIFLLSLLTFSSFAFANEQENIKNNNVNVFERVPEKNENVNPLVRVNNFDIHIFTNKDMENNTVPCYFWTVKNFENNTSK
jgi:hypothetical protein